MVLVVEKAVSVEEQKRLRKEGVSDGRKRG